MKSKLLFEVEALREMLKADVDALDKLGGLTDYSRGWRDKSKDILEHLDQILKEVSE